MRDLLPFVSVLLSLPYGLCCCFCCCCFVICSRVPLLCRLCKAPEQVALNPLCFCSSPLVSVVCELAADCQSFCNTAGCLARCCKLNYPFLLPHLFCVMLFCVVLQVAADHHSFYQLSRVSCKTSHSTTRLCFPSCFLLCYFASCSTLSLLPQLCRVSCKMWS